MVVDCTCGKKDCAICYIQEAEQPTSKIETTAVALGEHNLQLATVVDGAKFKKGGMYRIVAIEI